MAWLLQTIKIVCMICVCYIIGTVFGLAVGLVA